MYVIAVFSYFWDECSTILVIGCSTIVRLSKKMKKKTKIITFIQTFFPLLGCSSDHLSIGVEPPICKCNQTTSHSLSNYYHFLWWKLLQTQMNHLTTSMEDRILLQNMPFCVLRLIVVFAARPLLSYPLANTLPLKFQSTNI